MSLRNGSNPEQDLSLSGGISEAVARLISDIEDLPAERLDAGILAGIRALGEIAQVDRVYVFLLGDDSRLFTNTHEWCSPGIEPQSHRLQRLDLDRSFPVFAASMRQHEVFQVPLVSALPTELSAERREFECEGIQSLVVVPMVRNEELVGCLGFDSVRAPRKWSADEISLLKIIGKVIAGALARSRAEAALHESSNRFRSLIENLSDIILVADHESRCSYESPSASRTFRYPPGSLVGRNLLELIHPEDLSTAQDAFRELLDRTNPGTPTPLRVRCGDGGYLPTEVLGTNLFDQPGVRGLVITARDITDRVRATAERQALEVRVQQTQKLESLGVLAGGIAHDFNNLLTGVLGPASLALASLPPDDPVRDNVAAIEKTARRAAELTEQMLAYSGRGQFVVQPVQLSDLVQETADLLTILVSKKAVLRYEFASDLPMVDADRAQLRQVAMNLIVNASEALGDAPGTVTIRTGALYCDQPYLSANATAEVVPDGEYVFLEVTDTGIGMTPEIQSRVFDPFFTTKFTGRGLGLPVVLGIVRGHRGAILLSSKPNRGTAVRVLFPATTAKPVTVPSSEPVGTPGHHHGGQVLVVDDEEIVRILAEKILQRAGYRVLLAADGHQAIEVFAAHLEDPPLILLDLTMPRLDGRETSQRLKELRPDVRIILSSGYAEQEVIGRFAGMGIAGFVHKPYSAEELTAAVEKALG